MNRTPAKCQFCKIRFTPEERGKRLHDQCVDGWVAAFREKQEKKAQAARAKKASAERKEDRRKLEKLKTLGQHKADAQRAINAWIVHVRDAGLPCISCGAPAREGDQAGHYRSRGSAPHLALEPFNIARQCTRCNLHLHGNAIGMRAGMMARWAPGFDAADLEADNTPRKYMASDLQEIAARYRKLVRDARKSGSCQEQHAP